MLDQLSDSILSKNPDYIIFPGDMFMHRDRLSQMQVQLARKLFNNDLMEITTFAIPGNHDTTMSEEKVDSLSATFSFDGLPTHIYTQVGERVSIDENIILHMFPYPSREELARLGCKDIGELTASNIQKFFYLDKKHRHILVYHGILEGFAYNENCGSAEDINVGKELIIPESFWSKFDAVFAGHLHKHKNKKMAVYPGCPFPLSFNDSYETGWVLWEIDDKNISYEFIKLNQLYPYRTIDIGTLGHLSAGQTQEAVLRLNGLGDLTDQRVRVIYTVHQNQSGYVDHSKLSDRLVGAKDVKIIPKYIDQTAQLQNLNPRRTISISDFDSGNIATLIEKFIKQNKFGPGVLTLAKKIEDEVKKNNAGVQDKSIHFALQTLEVSNFKSFGEKNKLIDFTKLDEVVGIFGPNKSGKSSLVESIIWALFGTTIRNKDVKSVIRNGQSYCVVTITFESNKQIYKITRERSLSGAKLFLYVRGEDFVWSDISGSDMRQTQKDIEQLVGTFDIFTSTIYSPQNHIDHLVEKSPSERKQIILDCLQINVLESRANIANAIRKELKEKVLTTKGKAEAYAAQIDEIEKLDISSLLVILNDQIQLEQTAVQNLDNTVASLKVKLDNYEILLTKYEDCNVRLEPIRAQIRDLSDKISTKEKELIRLSNLINNPSEVEEGKLRANRAKEKIDEYIEELSILNNKKITKNNYVEKLNILLRNMRDEISLLENFIEILKTQLNNSDDLICSKPDCPIKMDIKTRKDNLRVQIADKEKEIEKVNLKYKDEIAEYKIRIDQLNQEIESSFYDEQEHYKYVRALKAEQDNRWDELSAKIANGNTIKNNLLELISAYSLQREGLQGQRDKIVEERNDIATGLAELENDKNEYARQLGLRSSTNNKLLEHRNQFSKYKQKLDSLDELRDKAVKSEEKLTKLELDLVDCEKYLEVVSKKGVIFSLVDKAIPSIEYFAQKLLDEATNGMISIFMSSTKKTTVGKSLDDVVIYITDSKGKRDVLEASGAELVLVSLALRAAMANLLSSRMGSSVDLFIVDEGMGALDSEGIISVKNMFKKLGSIFKRVLFITHISELKDIATDTINLETDGLTSSIIIKGGKE